MEKTLEYSADIQAIPGIRKDLADLAAQWNIPDSELKQITLITEELFSISIRSAFGKTEGLSDPYILIRVAMDSILVTLEFIDNGIPFNPLENNPVSESDPASADDGGMGLTLIKTFSDSISYSREDNRNHLTIRKTIKSKSL